MEYENIIVKIKLANKYDIVTNINTLLTFFIQEKSLFISIKINKRIENIRLYDAYGFKRDISFEYDKNTSFEVFIYYRQAGDSGLYCFYDKQAKSC